ncbi:MAG: hydrogenase nickel incorporation protein HypB [Phycisphaeraceae bacterium]|nr:hydrogenase nickel incorporation protein HypB [Phycisphaeraceae bacterium]
MKVQVVESVLKLNDEIAALNRESLRKQGIFCLDLIGGPGCGKTALLEATLRALKGKLRLGVLVGDLATTRDAERLARWTDQVVQINTGKGCHLDANQVRQAMARLDLAKLDVLVIENVGNLICPVGFDLGQDVKVGMFSVAEGDDKPAKHPPLVHEASLLLLNKIDLLPYVPFDLQKFRADVRTLNSQAELLEISVQKEQLEPWVTWLGNQVKREVNL